MKKIYSVVFVVGMSLLSSAQITTTLLTADEAVTLLVGPNLVTSNAAFTGDVVQLGSFAGATGAFEIGSGIILSTDGAADIIPGNGTTVITNPVNSNQDLLDVANSVPPLINQTFSVSDVNNVAILEFDFVASGPNLSFNYIFGSDEYLTYVNSSFNDVFAFFIAGPGIAGPYFAPAGFPAGSANIAVVPNSVPELPITISSVNNVLNSAYYIDNPNATDIQLNGYTVTLTATSTLECGETYHMRLAIADGSDDFLKSIVVLQEGSFEVNGTFIEATAVNPSDVLGNTTLLEGCINGSLVIHPPSCIDEQATVVLQSTGIAINGLDYSTIPSTVTFTSGEDVVIPITAILDEIVEGTESLIISLIFYNLQGDLDTATTSVNILDYVAPSVEVEDVFICGNSANAVAEITGGFGPYQYEWSSGQSSASPSYSEGDAGEYSVNLTDYCSNQFETTFSVIEPDPFVADESKDLCLGMFTGDLAIGGGLPYIIEYPADSLILQDYGVTAIFEGTYQVIVSDQCGSTAVIVIDSRVCDTVIPNVFTPDGNGKNDMFHIYGVEGFEQSKLQIFDRWGRLVFEDPNYRNTWSGADLADGVFYYIFSRSDGKVYDGYVHKIASK